VGKLVSGAALTALGMVCTLREVDWHRGKEDVAGLLRKAKLQVGIWTLHLHTRRQAPAQYGRGSKRTWLNNEEAIAHAEKR